MSHSYFGRHEPDGRRLGSDLALLGKWSQTFAFQTPPHSYAVSRLSPSDQSTLFSKEPVEFKIQEGPDHRVKLQPVQDGFDSNGYGQKTSLESLDPEVATMLHHGNYHKSQARVYEMCRAIEDSSDETDKIGSIVLEKAKRAGADHDTATKQAELAKENHRVALGRAVTARWKQERFEGTASKNNYIPPRSPELRMLMDKRKIIHDTLARRFEEALKIEDPPSKQTSTPPRAIDVTKDRASSPPSTSSSPAHGSDSSTDSAGSFGSSNYFTDESVSPFGSASKSTASANNLFSQLSTVEPALSPSHRSVTPPLSSSAFREHISQSLLSKPGHGLGAGLSQAFLDQFSSVSKNNNVKPGLFVTSNNSTALQHGFSSPAPSDPTLRNALTIPFGTSSTGAVTSTVTILKRPQPVATPAKNGTGSINKLKTTSHTRGKSLSPPPRRKLPKAKAHLFGRDGGIVLYEPPFLGGADDLVPEYWTTKAGKAQYLQQKLSDLKAEDIKLLTLPRTQAAAQEPIHIFVDLSNIIIGFYDSMKIKRGIPVQKRVNAPAFSFENFDALVTRSRKVEKRVVAGSLSSVTHSNRKKWPSYLFEAENLDYEMNILQRVPKPVTPALNRKKGRGALRDADTSGHDTSSGDDVVIMGPMKQGEQGVDELLHLKILQSALDNPSCGTIVLATGDAAQAEYSDGFKKNIERVLGFGWNIELYGWGRNISLQWRDPQFTNKWGSKFRIIELDDFCEELFGLTVEDFE